jgi:hypothetical protein
MANARGEKKLSYEAGGLFEGFPHTTFTAAIMLTEAQPYLSESF